MENGNLQMPLEGGSRPPERPTVRTSQNRVGSHPQQPRVRASHLNSAPSSSDKDKEQKRLLSELFWNWGYFVQPTVKLLHPGGSGPVAKELTDVDVYAVMMTPEMHIERIAGDCKSLQKVSAINRTFWLKGVMEYLGAAKGIMVLRTESEEDHKLTAKSMGITLLDDRTFKVFREKLQGQKSTKGTHLFDSESWQYFDANLSGQTVLESLLRYRRFRFWRDPHSRAARYSLMETRGVRSYLTPDQRHHVALVGDMAALFSLTLQGMVCELFPVYLVVDDKVTLDNYLKSYVYGGRDSYAVMNSLYLQVMKLGKSSTTSSLPETANSNDLALPEWSRFLQLFRAVLEHPNKMKDVPRFLRWVVFDRVLYPDCRSMAREIMPEVDTLSMKLALQITDYFCKASEIEPIINEQLDKHIGDAILAIASTQDDTTKKESQWSPAPIGVGPGAM